jgi:tetratricopeptide (TPR) repeat protein
MLNRKKYLIYVLCFFIAVSSLVGCYGPYRAERQYWLAQREYERFINKVNAASDSQEAEEIINKEAKEVILKLRKVELNYPLWPMAAQAKLLIANIYILEGLPDRAKKEYEGIIEEYTYYKEQCVSAMMALASLYKEEGNWLKAEEIYNEVTNEYLETQIGMQAPLLIARYYKSRAMNAEADIAYTDALDIYRDFIQQHSDIESMQYSMAALEQLVNVYGNQGRWVEAIAYLNDIIEDNSDSPLALQALLITGSIYEVQLNDRDKAFVFYKQAVDKFPESPLVQRAKERLELYGD